MTDPSVRVAEFVEISPDANWGKFTMPGTRTDGHPDCVLLNISLLHDLGFPSKITVIANAEPEPS